jgi:hypothetical protein
MPVSGVVGGLTCIFFWQGSVERPEGVDLADIMDQREPRPRPLYIHFQFGPEREAVHALVYTDIGKDRLDDTCTRFAWQIVRRKCPQTPGINLPAMASVMIALALPSTQVSAQASF